MQGNDQAGQPVKATYVRSQLSSQPAVVQDEVDPAFINDQYWLLFPFHVVWDSGGDGAHVEETKAGTNGRWGREPPSGSW